MKILLIIGLICVASVAHGRRGRRVKRDWQYASIYAYESAPGESFEPFRLAQGVKSGGGVKEYRLRGQAVDDGIFSIETDSASVGWIKQLKPLDREKVAEYKLTVSAYDSYGTKVEDDADLNIAVLDKNDNPPVFDASSLICDVQEDAKGKTFHQVLATDADGDVGQKYNVIKFSKVVGSEDPPGNRFSVMRDGSLKVIGGLDAEREPRVTFRIEAADLDGEDGGNKVEATVTVQIQDANDHAPVFLNEPYIVNISESEPIGSKVFQLEATDEDVGINSQVSFKIVSGNDDGQFEIKSFPSNGGNSVGTLMLLKKLDYETPPTKYSLTVIGQNAEATNADDVTFQTQTKIEINIKDVNEPPVFLNTPYKATIYENTDTKQQNLDVKINAVDYDFKGQEVTYSLQDGETWFEIAQDGTLKTLDFIDREDPRVDQDTSIYKLVVQATDPDGKFENAIVDVFIDDANDNAPEPYGNGWECSICENMPENETVWKITTITATDKDSSKNGPPFTFELLPGSDFYLEPVDDDSVRIETTKTRFDIGVYEENVIIKDTATRGKVLSSTSPVTINVCTCNDDGEPLCAIVAPMVGTASTPIIIGIVAFVLLLLILVLVAMSYSRRKSTDIQKRDLLLDDDDIRDTLRDYHDEGGGEEDNDLYDMAALQPLAPGVPYRMDEKPLFAQPQPRMVLPPDGKVEEYIDEAKKQADTDPSAPPFDSLLVFDYEGQGSDAGSLSSIASRTTEGSQDYDYLKDWGPRFKKIADAYGNYEE